MSLTSPRAAAFFDSTRADPFESSDNESALAALDSDGGKI